MKKEAFLICICSVFLALLLLVTGIVLYQKQQFLASPAADIIIPGVSPQLFSPLPASPTIAQPGVSEQTESLPVPTDPATEAPNENEPVGNEWFADALFIGDSRTVGLASYSGVKSTWYAQTSLNMSTAMSSKFLSDASGNSYTILEKAAIDGPFAKVYLWFGLNDLGGSPSAFVRKYKSMISQIQEMMPQAKIYVISVVPVSQEYADKSKYGVTNENCAIFNEAIKEMTVELGVYYINAADPFSNEDGSLKMVTDDGQKISGDGAHFNKTGVKAFFDLLRISTDPPPPFEDEIVDEPETETQPE